VNRARGTPWSALWFLYSRSWRNRLRQQLRRLKQPRYMVGALAMLAYVVSLLISPSAAQGVANNPGLLDVRHLLSISGLSLALGAWWIAAPSDSALAFSNAEVYFLFPAPVARQTLVQARLFSIQAVLLLQVLLWTLLLRRGTGDLPGVLRAIGLWVLFTTVSLHRLGATLARTHAPDVPRRKPIAQLTAVMFISALATAALFAAPKAFVAWKAGATSMGVAAPLILQRLAAVQLTMQALLDDPIVHVLVWPIRAATAPAFARTPWDWFIAMPAAIGMLALHYIWILRDPKPFEELAVGSSARFADRVARLRRGSTLLKVDRSRWHWQLALTGTPAMAIVWKNTTAAIRTFRPRSLILGVMIVILIASVGFRSEGAIQLGEGRSISTASTIMLSIFSAALLTAPAWFRLDLRHDLAHLPFLKTAPLATHRIISAEILTAALITTVAMIGLFGIPIFLLLRFIGGPLGPVSLAFAVAGGCVVLGGVNLLHITLYNAVALWLPAWVPLNQGGSAHGGASVIGQVYITLIAILTSLSVLLAAPVAVGWGIWLLLAPTSVPGAIVGILMLAGWLAVVIAEWLGMARLLGTALDRLEPSDIPSTQA
jgi:ABC-2 type transport system permease protein